LGSEGGREMGMDNKGDMSPRHGAVDVLSGAIVNDRP
jgi:hypothetical protein